MCPSIYFEIHVKSKFHSISSSQENLLSEFSVWNGHNIEIFTIKTSYLHYSHFEVPRALEKLVGLTLSSKFRLNEQV